jgi:ADP-glucose pyrophosphorylase
MSGEPEYAVISTGNVSADGMFQYDVYENRTAVITGGTANDICLTIPAMIDGYPVVEIGEGAAVNYSIVDERCKIGKNSRVGKEKGDGVEITVLPMASVVADGDTVVD